MTDTTAAIQRWLDEHRISEIECLTSDMSGQSRGKIVPRHKYDPAFGLRLPEAVFAMTVTGEYPEKDFTAVADPDMRLLPDASTICLVPWAKEPTAQIIHDCVTFDGQPVDLSPRNVLKRILALYAAEGWQPVIAPEMEFYLVQVEADEDIPLKPPTGRTKRSEPGMQSFSIESVDEYGDVFDVMYDWCEAQGIQLDTLVHEMGTAQMEINLDHGEALSRADQVVRFKRTVREVAIRNHMYATFMAKPMQGQPGSAMHLHQSVIDLATGGNLFSRPDGEASEHFLHFIGGLQAFLPAATAFFAPYVNSYRRLSRFTSAPINLSWGHDNRTCGLRVPDSNAAARRVENRVAGADANPYLCIASTLACGLIGLEETRDPEPEVTIDAHTLGVALPAHIQDALHELSSCEPLRHVFGHRFVDAFIEVKTLEWQLYNRVISSWEREYLLLNV